MYRHRFLRKAEQIAQHGELQVKVKDTTGCYPNMPKETIRFAMRDILTKLKEESGYDGVCVPKFSDKQPCAWERNRRNARRTSQKIPFEVMLDVMEFSLDNAMVRMPGGQILKQAAGIPMGDPLYKWDSSRFLADFTKSECYQKPLELEDGHDGTFLETRFWIEENTIRHRLKNDNEKGGIKVWRYQHWDSNTPFLQKRATLTACLRKVHEQASDPAAMIPSALDKIAEFRRLCYPASVLWKACNYLGASTGDGTWITIRNAIR